MKILFLFSVSGVWDSYLLAMSAAAQYHSFLTVYNNFVSIYNLYKLLDEDVLDCRVASCKSHINKSLSHLLLFASSSSPT